jgi:hypothetical protein
LVNRFEQFCATLFAELQKTKFKATLLPLALAAAGNSRASRTGNARRAFRMSGTYETYKEPK